LNWQPTVAIEEGIEELKKGIIIWSLDIKYSFVYTIEYGYNNFN
jgi:hypothetical protein